MHNINVFGTGDTAYLLQCMTLISSVSIHYFGQTQVRADGLIS